MISISMYICLCARALRLEAALLAFYIHLYIVYIHINLHLYVCVSIRARALRLVAALLATSSPMMDTNLAKIFSWCSAYSYCPFSSTQYTHSLENDVGRPGEVGVEGVVPSRSRGITKIGEGGIFKARRAHFQEYEGPISKHEGPIFSSTRGAPA